MGWAQPIFFWRVCRTMKLGELLEKTLPPMGYELVDWEMSPKGRYVRVFIDKPKGVDVEDCARVSRQLTRLFAVENVDFDRLEVSSPGLDRPLRQADDFRRFAGRRAKIVMREAVDGQTFFKGRLAGVDGQAVLIDGEDGRRHQVPIGVITRANLEVEF